MPKDDKSASRTSRHSIRTDCSFFAKSLVVVVLTKRHLMIFSVADIVCERSLIVAVMVDISCFGFIICCSSCLPFS